MSGTVKSEVISWVKTIVLAAVLAGLVNSFIIVNAQVPTGSMENTIMTGDRIVALRTSYWFDSPQRGDVVIFHFPDDPTGKTLYVKRVIGVPGDTVQVRDGQVLLNGQVQEEPYIREVTRGEYGPYVVPEGCYFMMGDNRNSSLDSRFWENKFVEKDQILGKVVMRYYQGVKRIS
ncbi:MAG: signal peptidase I [Anaerotignum sp.]|nr:signal peptidase I [Anaerotignum sp.]